MAQQLPLDAACDVRGELGRACGIATIDRPDDGERRNLNEVFVPLV
jgi:hypothetical protein